MKIIKAIKKNGMVIAEIETDQPETQDINIETGEVIKQSDKKLIVKVSTYDDSDELKIKDRLLKEVKETEEPYNFSDANLDEFEIKKELDKRPKDLMEL